MKKIIATIAIASSFMACENKENTVPDIEFNPPATKTVDHVDTLHGELVADPYRWLEDKEDADVKSWSEAQTKYAHEFIDKMGPEIEGLKEELTSIFGRAKVSPSFYKGNREFISKKAEGEQHETLYRIKDGDTLKIFSPADIDSSGNTTWFNTAFNKDGSIVAVATQYKGNEIATYRFFNTDSMEEIYQPISDLRSLVFSNDGKNAYVTRRDQNMIDNQIPLPIYLHKLGTDTSKDRLIMTTPSALHWAEVYDDENADYTYTFYGDFYSDTLHIKKTGSKGLGKKVFESDKFNAFAKYHDGYFYFITNDSAANFKIMRAPEKNPEYENWETFIAESENRVIKDFLFADGKPFVLYQQDVLTKIGLYDMEGNFIKELELPEVGNVGSISYNKHLDKIVASAKSYTYPTKVFHLDPETEEFTLFFEEETPINTDRIIVEQKEYRSKDGTMVPIFIMYDKDMVREGNNPTILYGYGGFNISLLPSFLEEKVSFIKRGGIYAVANLRGGSEYGEEWHRQGMLDRKQNVFDDFIGAAEYLIEEGYTNPNKLAISGRSNGGLLTGAAITQRPVLYKAVVIGVPLLDMVRYHKFLIAQYWIPEYGNADKEEDYQWLKAYSPYHNIDPNVNYPNAYIHAGEYDTRVDPLHAKKFAARMQAGENQTNPILLDVDFEAGHGSGNSGKSTEKLVAAKYRELKFIMNSLGME